MTYIDQTDTFRSLIAEGSKSASSSPASSRPQSRAASRTRHYSDKGKQQEDDGFLKEAYQIYGHLNDLGRMLKTVRKPYLSTAEPPPMSRRRPGGAPGGGDDGDSMRRFEGTKYLSERERDEVDVRSKMILRRCRERVGLLEESEKARQAVAQPQHSALYNFIQSLAPPSDDAVEGSSVARAAVLTAHRASIVWTLNNQLARLSATQADMQEERAKRRAERSRTLGSGAASEAAAMQVSADRRGGGSNAPVAIPAAALSIMPEDEAPIDAQLSAAQLQQFESENNALLEHMESQLSSVLAAEKNLLEISALQTELVRHLVQQTEVTDRLYDEAVGSVAEMGQANKQLKQAKERSGEARLFLLIFLFGASFALLFLDWYA